MKTASLLSIRSAAFGCLLLASLPAQGATVIKLATLVPDGSVWDKSLRGMGEEWSKLTDGAVQLRVYPGGVAGDESDVVRKMRIGQLHAGALTVNGLAEIEPAFRVFGVPLFFESYEELFSVLGELEPELEKRLMAKDFVFLNWGHAGWVHFFSKEPIRQVADLKRAKIFSSAGDDDMVQWWTRNGFHPVALAMTDIMTGLQTGMIDALPTTPLAALSLQWFRQVPYMHDLGLAPLVGATVIAKRAWERISVEDQAKIRQAAQRLEDKLEREIPRQDQQAVEEMEKRGLTLTAGNDEEWRQLADTFAPTMRGGRVPEEIFDLALRARDAFRQSQQEQVEQAPLGDSD